VYSFIDYVWILQRQSSDVLQMGGSPADSESILESLKHLVIGQQRIRGTSATTLSVLDQLPSTTVRAHRGMRALSAAMRQRRLNNATVPEDSDIGRSAATPSNADCRLAMPRSGEYVHNMDGPQPDLEVFPWHFLVSQKANVRSSLERCPTGPADMGQGSGDSSQPRVPIIGSEDQEEELHRSRALTVGNTESLDASKTSPADRMDASGSYGANSGDAGVINVIDALNMLHSVLVQPIQQAAAGYSSAAASTVSSRARLGPPSRRQSGLR
jgi:hypothetical protein